MKKKFLLSTLIGLASISALTGCEGPTSSICEHNYVETQVDATCTAEGYSNFTCSKCGYSYKGDKVIPLKNHSGVGKCSVCSLKFDTIWKDFITKNGENKVINIDGDIGVILSFDDQYDIYLYAITNDNDKNEITLTLAYNAYDQKWSWLFYLSNAFGYGTANGSFSKWSSHSSSLNCEHKTKYVSIIYTDSELLAAIKRLYNKIVNSANSKLSELGINITMANFGLEN